MEVIFNQNSINEEKFFINYTQKPFFSGDYISGFCWFFQNTPLFWEDTYFQLMASMRKMRIIIPLSFTPEMFLNQINILLSNDKKESQGRLKFTIFRDSSSEPSFVIEFLPYKDFFSISENEMDVYKEISIFPNLLSSIYIFHPINAIAEQYTKENDLQEVIILNNEKRIARAASGNIFYIQDNIIYSNPITEGAFISTLKKKFISFLLEKTEYIYKEENISPFQTQSANEIFILSDEKGIIPITKIRKTTFKIEKTHLLAKKFIGFALEKNKSQA